MHLLFILITVSLHCVEKIVTLLPVNKWPYLMYVLACSKYLKTDYLRFFS
jgi:hypothetical protein